MQLDYPTSPTGRLAQAWGNSNPKMYPGGRHMGVDLAGNVGMPIKAACPGLVETVNIGGAHGYGRHVIIEHGDFKTLYAHLHKVFVIEGQTLEGGALIGEMGGDPLDNDPVDGASTGPHLHFEVILPAEPEGDFVKTVLGWTVEPFRYLLERFAAHAGWTGIVLEAEGVRVRLSPGTSAKDVIIDARQKNALLEIVELKDIDAQTQWARLRALRAEWVCVKYQGRKFVEVKRTEDGGPGTGEKDMRLDELNRMSAYLEARRKELA